MIFSLNILNHNILLVLSVSNKKGIKSFNKMLDLGRIWKRNIFCFFISVTKIECFFTMPFFVKNISVIPN